jgi:leishmanolysin
MRRQAGRSAVRSAGSTRTRLGIEVLEDRVTPSWGSVPPGTIELPATSVPLALNSEGDAFGSAGISADETDWYRLNAWAGTYTFVATTPASDLDPVIAIYNSAGQRVAFNDDIAWSNVNSRVTVTLPAGKYFFGVTNYQDTAGGAYNWAILGPAAATTVSAVGSAFNISLQFSGLTTSQQAIFRQAANRWSQIITGDLPNVTFNGIPVDDVLIAASAGFIDGSSGVLGSAGPDRFRSGSLLPYHGTMDFDSADMAWMEASGTLYYTVLHEMGHVLGIGTIWEARGLLWGAGTSNPRFIGPAATATYNAIHGTSAVGVPVEAGGGDGTRDSHWRESVFGNEVMTGWVDSGFNPISRVTVASLRDLGYQVNMGAADI